MKLPLTQKKKKRDDTSEEEEKINYTFEIIVITDQVIGIFSVKSSALKEPSLVSNVTKVIIFGGIGFFCPVLLPSIDRSMTRNARPT